MNRFAVVCVLVAMVAAVLADDDKYISKYDDIDLDSILSNDRLLQTYVKCMVEDTDANCAEDAKELKKVLGEALNNDCAKCTDKQKVAAQKGIKFLYTKKPEVWKEIATKYDPKNEFINRHPELTKA